MRDYWSDEAWVCSNAARVVVWGWIVHTYRTKYFARSCQGGRSARESRGNLQSFVLDLHWKHVMSSEQPKLEGQSEASAEVGISLDHYGISQCIFAPIDRPLRSKLWQYHPSWSGHLISCLHLYPALQTVQGLGETDGYNVQEGYGISPSCLIELMLALTDNQHRGTWPDWRRGTFQGQATYQVRKSLWCLLQQEGRLPWVDQVSLSIIDFHALVHVFGVWMSHVNVLVTHTSCSGSSLTVSEFKRIRLQPSETWQMVI